MKRVKFCGGYCWVTEQLTEDENGMLLLTTHNTAYCVIFNYSSYYNDVLSVTIRKCANRFSMGVCNRIEFVRYGYYGDC